MNEDHLDTIPAPPPAHKVCSCCGREYTRDDWHDLPSIGVTLELEWRQCPCGNTLALEVAA
jgi:hypothetical protein